MDPFERFLRRTEILVRRRRAWRWARNAAPTTLSASVLVQLAALAGWLPAPSFVALAVFNLGLVAAAAWTGYRRSPDLDRALFRLDRALKTGELLLTLRDLREGHPFRPLLARRLIEEDLRPERVFYREGVDWRRSGAIAALALLVGVLWFGLETTWVVPRAGAGAGTTPVAGADETAALPPELQSQLERVRRTVPALPEALDPELQERLLSPRTSTRQLLSDLNAAQDGLLGLSSGSAAPPSGPGGNAAAPQARARQRQRLEELGQQLQALQALLKQGSGAGQALAELRRALEDLPDGPPRQAAEQALAALARGDAQKARQALHALSQDLTWRLQAEKELDALRQALEAHDAQEPAPQTAREPASEEPPAAERAAGATSAGERAEAATRAGPTSSSPRSADRGLSGEEAGSGRAEAVPASEPLAPAHRSVRVPEALLPAEPVARWWTRGLPLETPPEGETRSGYRLSYDRVEALLATRDLPAELREAVRTYFLGLIGQLNETP